MFVSILSQVAINTKSQSIKAIQNTQTLMLEQIRSLNLHKKHLWRTGGVAKYLPHMPTALDSSPAPQSASPVKPATQASLSPHPTPRI
jgi:hypothetical protein